MLATVPEIEEIKLEGDLHLLVKYMLSRRKEKLNFEQLESLTTISTAS
jgi:hypothetical protein